MWECLSNIIFEMCQLSFVFQWSQGFQCPAEFLALHLNLLPHLVGPQNPLHTWSAPVPDSQNPLPTPSIPKTFFLSESHQRTQTHPIMLGYPTPPDKPQPYKTFLENHLHTNFSHLFSPQKMHPLPEKMPDFEGENAKKNVIYAYCLSFCFRGIPRALYWPQVIAKIPGNSARSSGISGNFVSHCQGFVIIFEVGAQRFGDFPRQTGTQLLPWR